jgi:hypothetical protein
VIVLGGASLTQLVPRATPSSDAGLAAGAREAKTRWPSNRNNK